MCTRAGWTALTRADAFRGGVRLGQCLTRLPRCQEYRDLTPTLGTAGRTACVRLENGGLLNADTIVVAAGNGAERWVRRWERA